MAAHRNIPPAESVSSAQYKRANPSPVSLNDRRLFKNVMAVNGLSSLLFSLSNGRVLPEGEPTEGIPNDALGLASRISSRGVFIAQRDHNTEIDVIGFTVKPAELFGCDSDEIIASIASHSALAVSTDRRLCRWLPVYGSEDSIRTNSAAKALVRDVLIYQSPLSRTLAPEITSAVIGTLRDLRPEPAIR